MGFVDFLDVGDHFGSDGFSTNIKDFGEDVSDVIKLQGGVTQDAGGGIHIRGGRSSEVAYLVDGVSVTDAYDGKIARKHNIVTKFGIFFDPLADKFLVLSL